MRCEIFAEGAPAPTARLPRIHTRSRHYTFALHVLAGYTYDDACCKIGLNPRTAERWRTQLRRDAQSYFGRAVTYEFAARYALDPALRGACETRLRETPQASRAGPCLPAGTMAPWKCAVGKWSFPPVS